MRVICMNNDYYPASLSLNKEYFVIREEDIFYVMIDDSFEEYLFPKDLFKVVLENDSK